MYRLWQALQVRALVCYDKNNIVVVVNNIVVVVNNIVVVVNKCFFFVVLKYVSNIMQL